MRFSACSPLLPVFILSIFMSVATTAHAQESSSDTVAVESREDEKKDRPSGRLRISIDESGISVEGDISGSETQVEKWVRISDDRDYREKGHDMVRFGESVFVAPDEMVRGDLVVFGGDAIIEGRVTGDVVVIGGNIRARSGSEIKGDAVVIGGTLDEDEDAIIYGEVIMFEDLIPIGGISSMIGFDSHWFRWAILPVVLFIELFLAFLIILFLRDRVLVSAEHMGASFLKSFGVGLLSMFIGFFGLLIVLIPLFITLIGIPLGILLILSCGGVMQIAWTVFAYCLGQAVSDRLRIEMNNPFAAVLIGAATLSIPALISLGFDTINITPLAHAFTTFSFLLGTFAFVCGVGALVLSRFGSRPLRIPGGATPSATGSPTVASA